MNKMYIIIKKDAAECYRNEYRTKSGKVNSSFNYQWYLVLKKIEGMKIEVDTKYLFKNQFIIFNTIPIKGISNIGLRIMDYCVEKVINDKKVNKVSCRLCGNVQEKFIIQDIINNENKKCLKCNKIGYLYNI